MVISDLVCKIALYVVFFLLGFFSQNFKFITERFFKVLPHCPQCGKRTLSIHSNKGAMGVDYLKAQCINKKCGFNSNNPEVVKKALHDN